MDSFHQIDPMKSNSVNTLSFIVHPCALPATQVFFQHGEGENHVQNVTAERTAEAKPAVSVADNSEPLDHGSTAEELAQAAKQLRDQVKESIGIFRKFRERYDKEVEGVRRYASEVSCRRIWNEKVVKNTNFVDGLNKEDNRLVYQHHKLRTCLTHLNACASRAATETASDNADQHDPRGLQLEKIRLAGERVDCLAEKAILSEAACADLITELGELLLLVDSQSPGGSRVYRFDKRQVMSEGSDGSGGYPFDEQRVTPGGSGDSGDEQRGGEDDGAGQTAGYERASNDGKAADGIDDESDNDNGEQLRW
ncbi:hypothetical protein TruAng_009551 [Truncatella angustata]|nr:hypothetical protein TruAng_009551 [Truncatella angustata]